VDTQLLAMIIGAAISLVSTIAVMVANSLLQRRRMEHQSRQYPSRVVYDRQMQFFEAVGPILSDMNSYITTIDVWLGESGPGAIAQVKKATENNACLSKFYELLQRYHMYLPAALLEEANELHSECLFLSNSPDTTNTHECIHKLFAFENSIRGCVGADRLAEEIQKALSRGRSKKVAPQA
jgi:hypothetical protein